MERWAHEARVIAQLVVGVGCNGGEAEASFSSFTVDIWGCRHCLFIYNIGVTVTNVNLDFCEILLLRPNLSIAS
jgi:hypothetical protein